MVFARRLAVALILTFVPVAWSAGLGPQDIKVEKELIIRDLGVVEWKEALPSPQGGRFTLEALLAGISRDGTAKTALLDWLNTWVVERPTGNLAVGAELVRKWKKADGNETVTDAAWQPNFLNAPFRLLAITNRLDLQKRDVDGIPLNAGEGRFVFGVTNGPGLTGGALPATVIFEYELVARSEAEVLAWAQAWHALGSFPQFNDDYANALAAVTERFTKHNAAPGKPNGSALNQLRTNEIGLSGAPWNLREFRLDPATGRFFPATTKQTPLQSLATSPLVADYINSHEADILAQRHSVPRKFQQQAFLGRQADVPLPQQPIWNPAGVKNPTARYLFAFNTCNGCHGAEAQTAAFTHVANRNPHAVADLSPFLSDAIPQDPVTQAPHPELKEITARRTVMAGLLNGAPPDFFSLSLIEKARQSKGPSAEVLRLLESRANREH
jgi:hypothetical protein